MSAPKRDFASTIVNTASEVDDFPSPKKLRVGYGSTQAAPSKTNSAGKTGHRFPSSASKNHTHPSIYTTGTTRPLNSSQPGHGTMEAPIQIGDEVLQKPEIEADEAPIEIDDEAPQKPQNEPNVTDPAANSESKSAQSGNANQEFVDSGIGSWNDVKPWENDDELDDYLAKELADFPDDVEANEAPLDSQTDLTTTASAAVADPVPEPIFSNFRDQRPKTVADEIAVNKAIQHTYHDLGHKVGWDVVDAAFAEKVKEATTESYGHQYNTLQAIYVDKLVGKDYLATTKRKSKKQKKAERDVGFLYVGYPFRSSFSPFQAFQER